MATFKRTRGGGAAAEGVSIGALLVAAVAGEAVAAFEAAGAATDAVEGLQAAASKTKQQPRVALHFKVDIPCPLRLVAWNEE